MKIVPSLGLLALSVFPTFAQDTQPAAAAPLPVAPPAQSRPAEVKEAKDAAVSSNVSQVLKLAQSGVSDEVILAYVKNSRSFYNLGADDVLSLKDSGLSSPVISAMLAHDNALRAQKDAQKRSELAAAPAPAPAPAPTAAPAPAPAPAAPAPAPTVTVVAQTPAPPPQIEYVPVAPGPDYYWSDGYWSWRGHSWVWIGGSWSVRPGVHVWIGGGPRYGHWHRW